MKISKNNIFIALVLVISFVSCEKENVDQTPLSIEEEAAEFQGLLRASNTDEETAEDTAINCNFGGVIEAVVRSGHYVGVNEFPHLFGSDASASWTINGEVVNSRRPRFVRVNDHLSQPGTVEVCFSVTSSDCGTLGDCITINFGG